jgi:hypothetical protein
MSVYRSLVLLALLAFVGLPQTARAHCDALDGPVVTDARTALAASDPAPVLKWVAPHDEAEVRIAFEQTLRVRAHGPEAEALADRYFFETVVRLHRAFEGAPYTGLKPAGTDSGPGVRGADTALETGSLAELKALILGDVERGLDQRFQAALHAQEHADHHVEAGRAFVHAYVEFVHYAKRLHDSANADAAHAGGGHAHAH